MAALLVLAMSCTAAAQPRRAAIGDAPDGLAGIQDLPVAVLRPELTGTAVASGAFGLSVDEPWAETSRYRLQGALSGAFSPLPWLAFGLTLQGRWEDVTVSGRSDGGLVGLPILTLRLTTEPVEGLGLALDTAVWMYGGDAPSLTAESTSLRARAVASYRVRLDREVHLTVSAALGGLLDNSRAAAPRSVTDQLSAQDRVSLGVSDFHAILAGAGAIVRIGVVEALGELTYRALVGDGAPDPGASPLHVVLGARVRPIGELLELGIYADLLASESRASFVAAGGPAAPIDPRFTLTVSAALRFGLGGGAAGSPEREGAGGADTDASGTLSGQVVDEAGVPVEAASIEVHPAGDADGQPPRTASSDAQGRWTVGDVSPGPARVVVRREGRDPVELTVQVTAGEPAELQTRLVAALPRGEIRGTIQGSDGRPLEGASIRIVPEGIELTTDVDGAFEAEVPPGEYEVEVRAPGHRTQTRRVDVVESGVVLLNAQLSRAR